MKQYPIAVCFLALFVAACTEEPKNNENAAESKNVAAENGQPNVNGMKPLTLVLPQIGKEGTPVPIVLPNIDRRSKDFNPKINVPEDVFNIALKKPVTASDDFPLMGELGQVTDGEKGAKEYVELMGGLQWVQIDLEKTAEVFAIALWHRHDDYLAYKSVIIQLSDDPEFKSGVSTVFNNDYDNSAGFGAGKDMTWEPLFEGRLIALEKPLKARYVRLYSNGSTKSETNAYVEVEVYGR